MSHRITSLSDVLLTGNTTGGTSVEVSSGDDIHSAVGTPLYVRSSDEPAPGVIGTGDVTISSGSSDNGKPGDVLITAGSNGDATQAGGRVLLRAGGGLSDGYIALQGGQVLVEEHLNLYRVPEPANAQGVIFVSDGTGGLVTDKLYFKYGAGIPIELGGGGGAFMESALSSYGEVDGTTASKSLGSMEFAPDDYYAGATVSVQLRIVLSSSNAATTATFKLYNITDAEFVAASTLTTSSTTPVSLTVALPVGGAGLIKDASKVYEARIYQSGILLSDVTYLGSAVLRVSPV